jgi:hypothetical protein
MTREKLEDLVAALRYYIVEWHIDDTVKRTRVYCIVCGADRAIGSPLKRKHKANCPLKELIDEVDKVIGKI